MNRAEYINAVVHTAIEKQAMVPAEGARILAATLTIMNNEGYDDENLTAIWNEIMRRYNWVMVQEEKKPW